MTDARRVDVREGPLSVDEAIAMVAHSGAGGIAVFLGVVRDTNDGRRVSRLEYEAYEDQVEPRLAAIVDDMREKWASIGRIALLHRVGELGLTDAAVVVTVSAPHRDDAFVHTLKVVDAIGPTPVRRWAALLHDIGKAPTFIETPEGRSRFFEHDRIGVELQGCVDGGAAVGRLGHNVHALAFQQRNEQLGNRNLDVVFLLNGRAHLTSPPSRLPRSM